MTSAGSTDELPSRLLPNKRTNIRTLVINANGVSDKRALLENLVECTDPDVMIITETKLDSTINSSEFLPEGYRGDIRKDRNRHWGGVMIAAKCSLTLESVAIPDTSCETVWAKIMSKQNNPIYVGSFYRRNHEYTPAQITELEKVMDHVTSLTKYNPQATVILGGDFNAKDVDWENYIVKPDSTMGPLCRKLISFLTDFHSLSVKKNPLGKEMC